MRVHDPTFLDFHGEPITGQKPPRVIVAGNQPLTPQQEGGIAHAYKLFCDVKRVSQQHYHVQHRTLTDGTKLELTSVGGQDTVRVVPPVAAGTRYGLFPAFWFNAPGVADTMPDPVHAGTWTDMPYAGAVKSKEDFWTLQPGNRTWRNSRDDSTSKGVVLSWWGLGKDRYTSDWVEPDSAPSYESFPYGKLYCNGVKIVDFGSSTKAILGACVCEVDGQLKITVVESNWETFDYGVGFHIRLHGECFTESVFNDAGAAMAQSTALVLRVHQANLPAAFKAGAIRPIEFTQIASLTIVSSSLAGAPFPRESGSYAFFPSQLPYMPPTSGIVFNSQGTEGAFNINGRAYEYPGEGAPGIFVWGLRIDPRDGSLGEAITEEVTDLGEVDASDPDGFFADYTGFTCTVTQSRPVFGFDYEDGAGEDPDELVWVAQRTYFVEDDNDGVGGTTQRKFLQHSKYGVLRYDSYGYNPPILPALPVIDPSDNAVTDYRWCMTGDLRATLTQLSGRDGSGTLVKSFLEDVALPDLTDLETDEGRSTGYEGCDTSFDSRLIVARAAAQVQVFVDGVDVTASLTDDRLQDIRFPVLCGPLVFPLGSSATAPRQYVKGSP